jgi:hypothetical protein
MAMIYGRFRRVSPYLLTAQKELVAHIMGYSLEGGNVRFRVLLTAQRYSVAEPPGGWNMSKHGKSFDVCSLTG